MIQFDKFLLQNAQWLQRLSWSSSMSLVDILNMSFLTSLTNTLLLGSWSLKNSQTSALIFMKVLSLEAIFILGFYAIPAWPMPLLLLLKKYLSLKYHVTNEGLSPHYQLETISALNFWYNQLKILHLFVCRSERKRSRTEPTLLDWTRISELLTVHRNALHVFSPIQ